MQLTEISEDKRPSQSKRIISVVKDAIKKLRTRVVSFWNQMPTQFKHSFFGALLAGGLIAIVLYFALCEFLVVLMVKVLAVLLTREV